MKVQYQLVDVETKKSIPIDEVFEIVDFKDFRFGRKDAMSWLEAKILFGDPMSIKNPTGVLGKSPIAAAREALKISEQDREFIAFRPLPDVNLPIEMHKRYLRERSVVK